MASVKKVTDIVAEIAAASREQSSGIEQVNSAVMQMDELTQQNAALVEQATAASQAMADQARELNEMMARYRVAAATAVASTRRLELASACAPTAQRARRRVPRPPSGVRAIVRGRSCRCAPRGAPESRSPRRPRPASRRDAGGARIRIGRSFSVRFGRNRKCPGF